MKGIKVYTPPERAAPVAQFIDGLEPRLREKLIRQLIVLPTTPRANLREPHYKHFTLERYRGLNDCGSRDTMQALEQSLNILARLRERPELAIEYIVKEEKP